MEAGDGADRQRDEVIFFWLARKHRVRTTQLRHVDKSTFRNRAASCPNFNFKSGAPCLTLAAITTRHQEVAMMKKTIAAGTVALMLAGASLALAQQAPREAPGWRPSAEDVAALTDARIAGLRAGLKLTAEQERHWPAVETAIRDLAKERADRMKERRPHGRPPRGSRQRRQCTATPPGCDRAAPPGRRRHECARGRVEEARRCRRAALQKPRRWPEAPLRHAAAHGRRVPGAATGSAAPKTPAERNRSGGGDRLSLRRPPRAQRPPGKPAAFCCSAGRGEGLFPVRRLLDSPASLCYSTRALRGVPHRDPGA